VCGEVPTRQVSATSSEPVSMTERLFEEPGPVSEPVLAT
jgi:hypothetical protein